MSRELTDGPCFETTGWQPPPLGARFQPIGASFEPLWESMTQREQGRVVQLLVQRIDYDGGRGKVAITFHPYGIRALADERAPLETPR